MQIVYLPDVPLFISALFMLVYNLGKTRSLEPDLGHIGDRKK